VSKKTNLAVRQKYDVRLAEMPDGSHQEVALVPMNEALTLADMKRKQGIIKRVGRSVASWFRPKTSDADDEGTTEIGAAAAADTSESLASIVDRLNTTDSRRLAVYDDCDKMDATCVELGRGVAITADNAFASREGDQDSYRLESDDKRVLETIEGVDDRCDLPNEMPEIVKQFLKYGDDFEELAISARFLVERVKWLNQKFMYRHEDEYGRLESDAAFTMKSSGGRTVAAFKPWQVVHFRHDHQRGNLYGRSFFFHGRKPWRSLHAMEDGVVMNRLTRAVDRLVYMIPLPDNADEEERALIIARAKRQLKRRSVVDPNTGRMDFTKASIADDSDIFIGVDNKGRDIVKVERLGSSDVTGKLGDVEYFQNKVMMSTGVPKAYLAVERDVNAKATLSWQDIQYARIVRGVQKTAASGQRKIYDVQLVLDGIVPEKDLYKVIYPAISFVDEQMKMEIERLRWEIAVLAKGMNLPVRWILIELLGRTEEEAEEIVAEMGPQVPTGSAQPTGEALDSARIAAFTNPRLAQMISELRDVVRVVQAERLNRQAEF